MRKIIIGLLALTLIFIVSKASTSEAQTLLLRIIVDPGQTIKIDTTQFPDGRLNYEAYTTKGTFIESGFVTVDNSSQAQEISKDYYFYLTNWVWVTELLPNENTFSYWETGYPNKGSLDFRSVAQRRQPGVVPQQCCVLIASDVPINQPDAIFIAQSITENFSSTTASQLATALQLPSIKSRNVSDLAYELLITQADATGRTRWKPLRPNKYGVVHANIGEIRLFTERLSKQSTDWDSSLSGLREDYESIRNRDLTLALKHAGWWEIEYGFDIRSNAQILRDGPTVKPDTTYSDDFDCSDSDTMGCDLTWTEVLGDWDIASNVATKTVNADGTARAEHDVSSTNHFGEVDCTIGASFQWCGVGVRFSSSANTLYYYRFDNDSTSNNLFRMDAGTPTLLISSGNDYCDAACGTQTIKLTIDGNDLEGLLDNVSKVTYTDTAITTGTRCGLYGYDAAPSYNDFVCEDLSATPPVSNRAHIIVVN